MFVVASLARHLPFIVTRVRFCQFGMLFAVRFSWPIGLAFENGHFDDRLHQRINMQNTQVGDLLVASSLVDETVLNQSVCLLVYEDDETTIGLLLNRPMKAADMSHTGIRQPSGSPPAQPSSDANELSKTTEQDQQPSKNGLVGNLMGQSSLHFGGPLAGPVVAVHSTAKWAEAEAGDGVFVAAQRDNLEALLQSPSDGYRLIVGHLGWERDQLDNEIEAGIWHRLPATADVLMTDDSELWPRLIRRATANSVARWIGMPDVPQAAELN